MSSADACDAREHLLLYHNAAQVQTSNPDMPHARAIASSSMLIMI